jgi:hypothetical protein
MSTGTSGNPPSMSKPRESRGFLSYQRWDYRGISLENGEPELKIFRSGRWSLPSLPPHSPQAGLAFARRNKMKNLKQISLVTLLTLSLTTVASAGTISGGRSTAVGTISGGRTGTISGGRTGTISGGSTGTITGSRSGIISTESGSRIIIQQDLLAGFWSMLINLVW